MLDNFSAPTDDCEIGVSGRLQFMASTSGQVCLNTAFQNVKSYFAFVEQRATCCQVLSHGKREQNPPHDVKYRL